MVQIYLFSLVTKQRCLNVSLAGERNFQKNLKYSLFDVWIKHAFTFAISACPTWIWHNFTLIQWRQKYSNLQHCTEIFSQTTAKTCISEFGEDSLVDGGTLSVFLKDCQKYHYKELECSASSISCCQIPFYACVLLSKSMVT